MENKHQAEVSRRAFLKSAATGALAAAAAASSGSTAGASAAKKTPPRSKDKIRLGSVAWNFGRIGDDPPWTASIDAVGELGFEGIELIVAKAEQLDAVLTEPTLSNVLRQLGKYKMVVPQFVLYQSALADLASPDAEKRKRMLGVFEKGCQVAAKLGAPMINMVAPWPTVYRKQGQSYLPRYFQEKNSPREKFRFEVPRNFDWPKAWAEFVATMKEATAIARAAGLKFSLENHTHTFTPRADAFLRLWDEVRDDALGFNVDIGWIQLEREYPVVTIFKARGHVLNVHLRDIDAAGLRFVAPGDGCMDFEGVVAALRDIGFAGFMSFEQDGVSDMKAALRRGKEILEEVLAKTG